MDRARNLPLTKLTMKTYNLDYHFYRAIAFISVVLILAIVSL